MSYFQGKKMYAPQGTLSFTNVPARTRYYSPADVEHRVASLVSLMKQNSAATQPISNTVFHDVSPGESYDVRVQKGKENEETVKRMLRAYGIQVHDVTARTDMREKIDFYVSGSFGRLSVQFKVRNQRKNSKRNDLGVEYARIRQGRHVPLYCHQGRDRCSIADVYLCVDAVNRTFHVVPSVVIERASKRVHTQFEVEVSNVGSNGQYVIRGKHRESGGLLTNDGNSLTLNDCCIGQIRYFRPHRSDEGVFKAVFYMKVHSSVWEHRF